VTAEPRPSNPIPSRLLAGAAALVVLALMAVAALQLLGGSGGPAATGPMAGSPGASGQIARGSTEPSAPGSSAATSPNDSASPSDGTEASPGVLASPSPSSSSGGLPAFRHVYVVVMENEESTSIVGHPDAPYINSLIAGYGLATNYTGVAHPSQPNYIALFSGSTHGVDDSGSHTLSGTSLADQIEASGRDWRVYAENLPEAPCFTGGSSSGGPDGRGTYARKHNPAISFASISGDPARCAKIQNFSRLDPAAADYELIVPNLCNDMHDCPVRTGDTFLESFLPRIIDSPAMEGSVLFLTWDEGTSGAGGGGRVATVVIGPGIPAGFTSDTRHDHYSLVRTIENAWGLGCLESACDANDMREFWP